jgi:hypothetical protein
MNEEQLEILHEIAVKMHPHLGKGNHTSRLINQLANKEKLSSSDIFDLGKYYSRMVPYIAKENNLTPTENLTRIHALTSLKIAVYSYK